MKTATMPMSDLGFKLAVGRKTLDEDNDPASQPTDLFPDGECGLKFSIFLPINILAVEEFRSSGSTWQGRDAVHVSIIHTKER